MKKTKCNECALHVIIDDKCDCLFCRMAPKDHWEQREKNAHNWHTQICIEKKGTRCDYFKDSATK